MLLVQIVRGICAVVQVGITVTYMRIARQRRSEALELLAFAVEIEKQTRQRLLLLRATKGD